jgi:hypothetical protein
VKHRNSNGKVIALRGNDRNREVVQRRLHAQASQLLGSAVAPYGWQALQPQALPEGAAYAGKNARCAVVGWLRPNPFGPPGQEVQPMMHLAVAERGRPLIWEEMLEVVREVCGPQAEAVELYPALRRELRGERNRHLYAFLGGEEWPIGEIPEGEARRREQEHAIAEQVGAFLRDKMVVFQVPDPATPGAPFRIFRDVADAVAAGLEAAALREGNVGAVPHAEGFEWSPAAEEYCAQIEAEASALRDRLTQELAVAGEATVVPIAPELVLSPEEQAAKEEAERAVEVRAEQELAAMRAALVRKDEPSGGDV